MFVSVIVPAYNEEQYLPDCLESLDKQSVGRNYEVLVVDNASTDNTQSVACNKGARVVFEPRRGIASALQAGFDNAKGDVIAVTEADTRVPPHWLECLCHTLLSRPEVVAVTGPYDFWDSAVMNFVAKLWFGMGYHTARSIGTLVSTGDFPLVGPNYAIRTAILRAVNGVDTSLRTSVDADLSVKIIRMGEVVFLPNLLVHTSARRFRANPLGTALVYTVNYIGMTFFRRVLLNRYPDFR